MQPSLFFFWRRHMAKSVVRKAKQQFGLVQTVPEEENGIGWNLQFESEVRVTIESQSSVAHSWGSNWKERSHLSRSISLSSLYFALCSLNMEILVSLIAILFHPFLFWCTRCLLKCFSSISRCDDVSEYDSYGDYVHFFFICSWLVGLAYLDHIIDCPILNLCIWFYFNCSSIAYCV